MGIKRYTATSDTTITNAYKMNLSDRGTDANMGASDILDVFSIYGQASSTSTEKSRALLDFPVATIDSDRTEGDIPASGSVNFFLRLFNAKHSQTVPRNFTLTVSAVSTEWEEGVGLDMESYTDLGSANWVSASSGSGGAVTWATEGGDYFTDASSSFDVTFDSGVADLEVDITPLVEQWISSSVQGEKANYGIGVALTGSHEIDTRSYYTKRFFARGSEFFFKRPVIEARWNSATKDDRANFYVSSSLASPTDNLNTLYFYNYVRGQLKNIPNIEKGQIYVKLYTSGANGEVLSPSGSGSFGALENAVTGGYVSAGVYTASFALDTSASIVYDRWFSGSGAGVLGDVLHTSSFNIKTFGPPEANPQSNYVTSTTNLKATYSPDEASRFRFYTRRKDWNPTIYTKSSTAIESSIVEDAYYKIFRIADGEDVINYGTGSASHTKLSFDSSGSYFDLDMSLLERDYAYGIKLVYFINNGYREQSEVFKFRVE
jgi:hypothetical protein